MRNDLEGRNLCLKLSTLEAGREHMSSFCPPSNRIQNPNGKFQSTGSCVFFKHASEEPESLAKKWHPMTNCLSLPCLFSCLPPLPFLSHLPIFQISHGFGFDQLPMLQKPMCAGIHCWPQKTPQLFFLYNIYASPWGLSPCILNINFIEV